MNRNQFPAKLERISVLFQSFIQCSGMNPHEFCKLRLGRKFSTREVLVLIDFFQDPHFIWREKILHFGTFIPKCKTSFFLPWEKSLIPKCKTSFFPGEIIPKCKTSFFPGKIIPKCKTSFFLPWEKSLIPKCKTSFFLPWENYSKM